MSLAEARRAPLSKATFWLIVVGPIVLLALLGRLWCSDVDPDLDAMPESERRALYERTRETLAITCASPHGTTLLSYCRSQASFLQRFPECDEACRASVAHLTPQPTR